MLSPLISSLFSYKYVCGAIHTKRKTLSTFSGGSSPTSPPSFNLSMNFEGTQGTDPMENLVPPPSEHFCYVRCNFCSTVLAVAIPCKRLMETVTVKCGHCSNLSFLSTRPPLQGQCLDHHQIIPQGFCPPEVLKKGPSPSSSSSTSSEPVSPKAPFVVKPPEKKHRLPSAYNRFMKEEIQRIKAANPEIPHREAFSTAAKNWARYVPNSPSSRSNTDEYNNNGLDLAGMKYYM